jgi:hypothetical protein
VNRLAIVALLAVPALVASCWGVACDCAGPGVGIVVWTAAPITQVALSGSACAGGRFHCRQPVAAENTIPPDCTDVWVEPNATGECIIDLTVGGTNMRLQHRARVSGAAAAARASSATRTRSASSTYGTRPRPVTAVSTPPSIDDRTGDAQFLGVIRKLASGQYRLYSRKRDPKTGRRRNLGTFPNRAAAEKHERAVQFFKRR